VPRTPGALANPPLAGLSPIRLPGAGGFNAWGTGAAVASRLRDSDLTRTGSRSRVPFAPARIRGRWVSICVWPACASRLQLGGVRQLAVDYRTPSAPTSIAQPGARFA